ncbi:OB-fold nucleic acid binding domain-containing protein [Thermococcus waiotapuensis]|uniref:OB-fold nucleic acid binding domain-containing protein n=1 Tax=Thermococcus waiotapuensis TaxID=90909 RepID=A0AAE4NWW1_9EURY|nr:OB-fold nucleic acid binding domain-containing protein [Thermococcus waiotapuensis]MDV3104704.1 OB-fold nucleic acid binding domain-containing protein [Thermococcus waiotapuensis]
MVFIPSSAISELDNTTRDSLKKGLGVRMGGYVEEYQGTLEVVPYTGKAILAHGEPLPIQTTTTTTTSTPSYRTTTTMTTTTSRTTTTTTTTTTVRRVTLADLASASGNVTLEVTWVKLYYVNSTYVMLVKDSSGEANLTVSNKIIPNPFEAGTGSLLRITYDATNKRIVSISVVNAVPARKVSTGSVTLDMKGVTVIVEGTVVDVYTGSTYVKLTVDDGSGKLVVFIPKSVAGDMTFEKGQTVRVGGYVDEYKGTVEVIPYTRNVIEVR